MKRTGTNGVWIAVAAIIVAAVGNSAPAGLVVNYSAGGSYDSGGVYTGEGMYGGAATWNGDSWANLWNIGSHTHSTAGLTNYTADGGTTDIAFTVTSSGMSGSGGGPVLRTFWVTQSTSTFSLSDVPQGVYDLYLYGTNYDQTRGTVFTLTSGSGTAHNGINYCANVPISNFSTHTYVYTEGVDYVVFNNVSPDADGNISGTYTAYRAGSYSWNNQGNFNGLQLVAVPEPAMLSLTAAGLCGLIARPRRSAGRR